MKLPKDLESVQNYQIMNNSYSDNPFARMGYRQGFSSGAEAVLGHEKIKKLEEALNYLLDAKLVVDEATVPLAGIEAAPDQVVFNWHCSYSRIKKARLALADFRAWRDGE